MCGVDSFLYPIHLTVLWRQSEKDRKIGLYCHCGVTNAYKCLSNLSTHVAKNPMTLLNFNGVSKLSKTFSLSKLQAVPQWNAEAVVPAPHSGGASSATSSTRLASDYTIDRAEPCFITNVSAYTHQQVHFINAIRGNSDKHADDIVAVVSPCPASDLLLKRSLHFSARLPSKAGYCWSYVYAG